MKKLLVILLMLLIATPLLAAPVQLGGYSMTPVTKTDTNADDANTNTTETDTVVWTPASGQKIVLMGVVFTSAVATTLRVETGSTLINPPFECTASGLVVVNSGFPIWQGEDDATLTYTVEKAGRHSILMYGYETD